MLASLVLMNMLSASLADDTAAILNAVAAASAAAAKLGTVSGPALLHGACMLRAASIHVLIRTNSPQLLFAAAPLQSRHDIGFLNGGDEGMAVYLPPGNYVVTQTIEIQQSNVVLRGAGVRWSTASAACRCTDSLPTLAPSMSVCATTWLSPADWSDDPSVPEESV